MLGTLINVGTVLAGSGIGLLLGHRLPERISQTVFGVLGLFTLYMGVSMSLGAKQVLVLIFSLLIGAIIGEWLNLEARSERLIKRLQGRSKDQGASKRFTEALLTAFMLFCVGAMTLVGCIQEGINGDRSILLTKSLMDFFSSMALAAALGRGVLFAAIPLLIYQGGITLGAAQLEPILTPQVSAELIGVGGILLIGLGLNILKITQLRLLNYIPALLLAPLFSYLLIRFELI